MKAKGEVKSKKDGLVMRVATRVPVNIGFLKEESDTFFWKVLIFKNKTNSW